MTLPSGKGSGFSPSAQKYASYSSRTRRLTCRSLWGENKIGLADSEWGQIRFISMQENSGSMIGPPAERA